MTSTKVSARSNLVPLSSCRTQTPGRQANFTLAISNRFDALSLPDDDVQVLYSGIVPTVQNATEEVVGKPHLPLGICQIRGPCPSMQCGQVLIPTETHHSLKTMVTLCHDICKAHEEDDCNYLTRQIAELELADRQNAPKGMWKIIGEIQHSFQGQHPKQTCYQLKARPNWRMEEVLCETPQHTPCFLNYGHSPNGSRSSRSKLVTTVAQKVKWQSKASRTQKLLVLTLLCELKPSSIVAKDCSTS